MRELKLRYFLDLVSNIGAKSRAEAQAVERSQRAMQAAVDKTSGSVRGLDTAFARWGANQAAERQLGYMRRLAVGIDQVTAKTRAMVSVLQNAVPKAVAIGGGAAGAFYAGKTLLDKPVDYDTRLRGATATAYAGQGEAELRAGLKATHALVKKTTQNVSGASRDATLGAFEKLVGSGSFTREESESLLPTIMKTAVAGRADANDLVLAAEKLKMGELKLSAKEIPLALAKIMRAGQEGGFEIKDASKHIGLLTPLMKGYSGMAGVEALVTMMQQARSTAGTNDQAATNLVNFLQKIPAESTRKDFQRQGIDLDQEMVNGALRGATPVETYMAALDKVMAKQDPEGKARAAMKAVDSDKSLTDEDRKERYARVAEIYKSAGISKIINDIQEFGGYSGLAGTKEYGKKVLGAVRSETGEAVNVGHRHMAGGLGAKMTDAANVKDNAAYEAMLAIEKPMGSLLDATTYLGKEFPTLTTAVVGTTGALGVFATALLAFGVLGGRNAGGLPGRGGPGGWAAGSGWHPRRLFTASRSLWQPRQRCWRCGAPDDGWRRGRRRSSRTGGGGRSHPGRGHVPERAGQHT